MESEIASESLLPREAPEVIGKSPDAAILFSLMDRCPTKTDLIKSIAEVSRRQLEQSFLWYIEYTSFPT